MPSPIRALLAVLCVLFTTASATATDHITVDIEPNADVRAGFGELEPGYHDLRVTMQWESGLNLWPPSAGDVTGMTTWYYESIGSISATYKAAGATEDELGWVSFAGYLYEQDPYDNDPFTIRVSNVLFPCLECMPCGYPYCSLTEEGEVEICVPRSVTVPIDVHHGVSGTLTILGAGNGIEVLNTDLTPFTSEYVTGNGVTVVDVVIKADVFFSGEVPLTVRFLQDGAELDSQDTVKVIVKDVYECAHILNPPGG